MKDFNKREFHPTEMPKLINLLVVNCIPFQVNLTWNDTIQLFYPSISSAKCDIVCHGGSYGHEKGLLEMMGLTGGDDVKGWLTAEDVFTIIKNDFNALLR